MKAYCPTTPIRGHTNHGHSGGTGGETASGGGAAEPGQGHKRGGAAGGRDLLLREQVEEDAAETRPRRAQGQVAAGPKGTARRDRLSVIGGIIVPATALRTRDQPAHPQVDALLYRHRSHIHDRRVGRGHGTRSMNGIACDDRAGWRSDLYFVTEGRDVPVSAVVTAGPQSTWIGGVSMVGTSTIGSSTNGRTAVPTSLACPRPLSRSWTWHPAPAPIARISTHPRSSQKHNRRSGMDRRTLGACGRPSNVSRKRLMAPVLESQRGRRGLNPRPTRWQRVALPLSYALDLSAAVRRLGRTDAGATVRVRGWGVNGGKEGIREEG